MDFKYKYLKYKKKYLDLQNIGGTKKNEDALKEFEELWNLILNETSNKYIIDDNYQEKKSRKSNVIIPFKFVKEEQFNKNIKRQIESIKKLLDKYNYIKGTYGNEYKEENNNLYEIIYKIKMYIWIMNIYSYNIEKLSEKNYEAVIKSIDRVLTSKTSNNENIKKWDEYLKNGFLYRIFNTSNNNSNDFFIKNFREDYIEYKYNIDDLDFLKTIGEEKLFKKKNEEMKIELENASKKYLPRETKFLKDRIFKHYENIKTEIKKIKNGNFFNNKKKIQKILDKIESQNENEYQTLNKIKNFFTFEIERKNSFRLLETVEHKNNNELIEKFEDSDISYVLNITEVYNDLLNLENYNLEFSNNEKSKNKYSEKIKELISGFELNKILHKDKEINKYKENIKNIEKEIDKDINREKFNKSKQEWYNNIKNTIKKENELYDGRFDGNLKPFLKIIEETIDNLKKNENISDVDLNMDIKKKINYSRYLLKNIDDNILKITSVYRKIDIFKETIDNLKKNENISEIKSLDGEFLEKIDKILKQIKNKNNWKNRETIYTIERSIQKLKNEYYYKKNNIKMIKKVKKIIRENSDIGENSDFPEDPKYKFKASDERLVWKGTELFGRWEKINNNKHKRSLKDDPNKIIDYLFQTDEEFILEKIQNYKRSIKNKSWAPVDRSEVSKLLKLTKQEFRNYYMKKLIQEKKNKLQKTREKIREIERQKKNEDQQEEEVYRYN
jgi:hypothetical protein